MSGKFAKKQQNKKLSASRGWVLAALIVVVAAAIAVSFALSGDDNSQEPSSSPTGTASSAPTVSTTAPQEQTQIQETSVNLGYGLEITDVGGYTGAYMEDGSNEVVSDVMMIVVRNNGTDDLQFGQITVSYGGDSLYHFEVTNLSAGSRAVLLETGRQIYPGEAPVSAILENPILFSEPMELCEDAIEIQGLDGMMNVKNISGTDISGDIYIYYKYSATDLFYGGITFRVVVSSGLTAGELRQIPAAHFDPAGCTIVQVTYAD